MRIMIAGGAGFIGVNLANRLLSLGHEVIVLDNLSTGREQNVRSLLGHRRFTYLNHDVSRPFDTLPSLADLDEIYNLACPTGVPNIGPLAEEMLLASSSGARNLLELARLHKARLLFTSSSEIYGDPQVSPQTEDYAGNVDPLGARAPYEEGKRFAETLLLMYVKKYGLAAKLVRLFNTYGPGMSLRDTRVIPRFLTQALSGQPLTVEGDGSQTRTFCYVDDLVEGLLLVMGQGRPGEVYNLGTAEPVTILGLAQMIKRITQSTSPIQFVARPAHDHYGRLPSLEKVKQLGWTPRTPLEIGLQRMVATNQERVSS